VTVILAVPSSVSATIRSLRREASAGSVSPRRNRRASWVSRSAGDVPGTGDSSNRITVGHQKAIDAGSLDYMSHRPVQATLPHKYLGPWGCTFEDFLSWSWRPSIGFPSGQCPRVLLCGRQIVLRPRLPVSGQRGNGIRQQPRERSDQPVGLLATERVNAAPILEERLQTAPGRRSAVRLGNPTSGRASRAAPT
jgi:hypothetical protein